MLDHVSVSFQAPDRASVHAFHDTALRHSGRDAGEPGLRRGQRERRW